MQTCCVCERIYVCMSSCLIAPPLLPSGARPHPITQVSPQAFPGRFGHTTGFLVGIFTFTIIHSIVLTVVLSHSSWLSFSGLFFCSSLHFSLYFILFFSADRDKSSSKFTISGFVENFKVEFYGCGRPGYSTVLMGPNKPGCSGVLLNSGMRGREKVSFSPVTCRNPHP